MRVTAHKAGNGVVQTLVQLDFRVPDGTEVCSGFMFFLRIELASGWLFQGASEFVTAAVAGVHGDAAAGVAAPRRALRVPQGDHLLPAQQGTPPASV